VRVVLPLLPSLAASSPYAEGAQCEALDARVVHYCMNATGVPSVVGACIPDPMSTQDAYQAFLRTLYADLAPYDTSGILQEEWINGRGAIARFDRWAIEIRLLDMQEHPAVDVAICQAITAVVRALTVS